MRRLLLVEPVVTLEALLVEVAREVQILLGEWGPDAASRYDLEQLLSPAYAYAQGIARLTLGVRDLTLEQDHAVKVCARSHVETWQRRALAR